jgi:hypothetical protein
MRFINSSENIENIDKKETHEVKINKIGRPFNNDTELAFAKMFTTSVGNGSTQIKHTILTYNNQPYDPYGTDSHRESRLNLVPKTVNSETYNYYVSYLKTKNSLYMTRTQRSFING